jgi:ABC-type uncharacterized transport system substrate-binding protein
MRRLRLAIIFVFLAATAAAVVAFNTTKPRVLVVQSYDTDYAWTRDVDVGIQRILKDKSAYSVRWFYMDTKRHPWNDYKVNAGKTVTKLIDRWQPSVVIAVDDDANEFAIKHFANHPEIRIVFSGVNDSADRYGYDKAANVTGILEKKPYGALKDTLLLIAAAQNKAQPLRIMFIGDTSDSVKRDEHDFRSFNWGPIKVLESRMADTFADWQAAVNDAAREKADFIVTANYRKIRRSVDGKALVPPAEVMKWSEANSRVPIIGTNAFFVEDGGALAIATSPYEQGEVAATMANEILGKGKTPDQLPIQSTRHFVVAMSESGMKKWQIRLPAVYEAAARSSANFHP